MAAALERAVPGVKVETVPGGKGDFRIRADGKLLWDKRGREGRFPEPDEIVPQLASR